MAMVAGVEEKANVVAVKLIMVRMLNTNFMEFSDFKCGTKVPLRMMWQMLKRVREMHL
jgi:hypothetical protein